MLRRAAGALPPGLMSTLPQDSVRHVGHLNGLGPLTSQANQTNIFNLYLLGAGSAGGQTIHLLPRGPVPVVNDHIRLWRPAGCQGCA